METQGRRGQSLFFDRVNSMAEGSLSFRCAKKEQKSQKWFIWSTELIRSYLRFSLSHFSGIEWYQSHFVFLSFQRRRRVTSAIDRKEPFLRAGSHIYFSPTLIVAVTHIWREEENMSSFNSACNSWNFRLSLYFFLGNCFSHENRDASFFLTTQG